ncbi:helix-turn-helix domain-containing protein [Paenibacillus chitinolyticus]|uniref:helix-turn-helix domain-containing protein n=1 Tax=Paenibacillus chitinolyticus TaxID=79263 RepID=UPI0036D876AF
MTLVDTIKGLMKEQGLTQYKLAQRAGIPHSTMSTLLNGSIKNPSADMVARIAEVLQVTTDYLLGLSDLPSHEHSPNQMDQRETRGQSKNSDPHRNEKEFVDKIELSDEELLKHFSLELDGRELSKSETKNIIAFVRTLRQNK